MIVTTPAVIAAYPRSGSTWLRFVLCNLLYPSQEHDFASVNRCIPPIDDPAGLLNGIDHPLFYKTHAKVTSSNIVYVYRHVGDVLESEWWYKRKMWDEKRSFEDYLKATEFGKEWREHVEHYFPAISNVSYEQIGMVATYERLTFDDPLTTRRALEKAEIDKMRKLEERGFGIYPSGNTQIDFCRKGESGNWKQWAPALKQELLDANKVQLKLLGYAEIQ